MNPNSKNAARSALTMTFVGAGVALVLISALGLPLRIAISPYVMIGVVATLVFAHFGGAMTAGAVAKKGVAGLLAGAALAITVLALGSFVGGFVAMIASPTTFDFADALKPVYWVLSFGALPAIALGVVHAIRAGRERTTEGRARVAIISTLVLLAPVAMALLFVDRHETVVHAMRLSPTPTEDRETFELVFVHFPAYHDRVWAPGFDDFVKRQPDGVVNARYRVMRDFGRVRGYQLIEIEGWDGPVEMRGGGASPGPSPWQ